MQLFFLMALIPGIGLIILFVLEKDKSLALINVLLVAEGLVLALLLIQLPGRFNVLTFDNKTLVVRGFFGFPRRQIPIAEIEQVSEKKEPSPHDSGELMQLHVAGKTVLTIRHVVYENYCEIREALVQSKVPFT